MNDFSGPKNNTALKVFTSSIIKKACAHFNGSEPVSPYRKVSQCLELELAA